MVQMYKVFIDNRVILLTEKLTEPLKNFKDTLFYTYNNNNSLLKDLIDQFIYSLTGISSMYILHDDKDLLLNELKYSFKTIHAAGGVVQNSKNEILVIKRKGKWDIPKGKIDLNESIEDAAIREVEEECNIKNPKIIEQIATTYHMYIMHDEPVIKETHWFDMVYSGNDPLIPQAQENITDVKWVPKEKMDFVMQNTFGAIEDLLSNVL